MCTNVACPFGFYSGSSEQRTVLPLTDEDRKVFTFENPTADTQTVRCPQETWENQLDPKMLNKIVETNQNLSDLLFKSATEATKVQTKCKDE